MNLQAPYWIPAAVRVPQVISTDRLKKPLSGLRTLIHHRSMAPHNKDEKLHMNQGAFIHGFIKQ